MSTRHLSQMIDKDIFVCTVCTYYFKEPPYLKLFPKQFVSYQIYWKRVCKST